jgi:hypothetical protein
LRALASVDPGANEMDDWNQLKFANLFHPERLERKNLRVRVKMNQFKKIIKHKIKEFSTNP